MDTRTELSQGISGLEAKMPALMTDMNAFFDAFEHEAASLLAVACPADYPWLEGELLYLVERHGISPDSFVP
jgi:hypothetical protein